MQNLLAPNVPNACPLDATTLRCGLQDRLAGALQTLNNQHPGSLKRLEAEPRLQRLSTGLKDLDSLLEGGLPLGRIVEVFGQESSGKTTFLHHCIAQSQKQGGLAALVEVENSLDPVYSSLLGVNECELAVSRPSRGSEAIEIIGDLIKSNAFDFIGLDSVTALIPELKVDSEFYADDCAHAHLLSQGLRYLNSLLMVAERPCLLMFTNQMRYTGKTSEATGGKAMKFYASLRLELQAGAQLKQGAGNCVIGRRTKLKLRKSKVSHPFGEIVFDLILNQGLTDVAKR